jgi:membrane-bound lytic murein transglycosylase B
MPTAMKLRMRVWQARGACRAGRPSQEMRAATGIVMNACRGLVALLLGAGVTVCLAQSALAQLPQTAAPIATPITTPTDMPSGVPGGASAPAPPATTDHATDPAAAPAADDGANAAPHDLLAPSAAGPEATGPEAAGPEVAGPVAGPGHYGERADVQAFAQRIAARDGFSPAEIVSVLSQAEFQPDILRYMEPAGGGRPSWLAYRTRFVTGARIAHGAAFLSEHQASLARAEQAFGVPAAIIVAIIGVETEYGRNTGDFRTLDALATLAFDYPRRAAYFQEELEHFLILAREEGAGPAAFYGSFAGAIGIAQFMPGSIRRWAVDFDGDGRRDLLGSPADAIGSIAHYLREHGWQPGAPSVVRAGVRGTAWRGLLDRGLAPSVGAADLARYGVQPQARLSPHAEVCLIQLESPGTPALFYLGLRNFYAITRYNQSSFYAMSVIELAQAIEKAAAQPPRR